MSSGGRAGDSGLLTGTRSCELPVVNVKVAAAGDGQTMGQ
jgi:hypothetical protein